MAEEDVEIVRGAVEAYNVGDMDAFDRFFATGNLRGAQIARVEFFVDHHVALKAAGLEE